MEMVRHKIMLDFDWEEELCGFLTYPPFEEFFPEENDLDEEGTLDDELFKMILNGMDMGGKK
jgi:hypothetical protein